MLRRIVRKLRPHARRLTIGVLVLGASLVLLLVVKPMVDHRLAEIRAENAAPGTTSIADPSGDYQALPPPPAQKEEDPNGCNDYFGITWTNRIQPALVDYLAFPSQEPTDAKLAALRGKLTPDFFTKTQQTWSATTDPRSWVTNVRIDTCSVRGQVNHVQDTEIGAFLTSADASGATTTVYYTFDVFLVRMSGTYNIAAVAPAGSVTLGGGG